MNERTLEQSLILEFIAASDFLYEYGFYDASAALRILYPKLPKSMLNKVYIFRELIRENVDISRFKIRLSVDALYEDNNLVGEHHDCNVDIIDFTEMVEIDSKTLIIKCIGVFSNITRQSSLKTLSLVVDGIVYLTRLTDRLITVISGDSVNLTYTMEMPDYLLPSEVVSNFKPDYSIIRIEA